jgi:hypothetical protein
MRQQLIALVLSAGFLVSAQAAAPEAELLAPVHQFVDSFNKGDAAGAEAANVSTGIAIVDEVPPHLWQGAGAFKAWSGDLDKHDKAAGMTEQQVTLGKVHLAESNADTAYIALDAVYSYKQNGAAMREPAQMTFALRKVAGGWKIAAWTWTGSKPQKAAK